MITRDMASCVAFQFNEEDGSRPFAEMSVQLLDYAEEQIGERHNTKVVEFLRKHPEVKETMAHRVHVFSWID